MLGTIFADEAGEFGAVGEALGYGHELLAEQNTPETDQRNDRRGGRTDTEQAVDDANQQSRSQRDEIDFHDVRPPSLRQAFTKASKSALRMSA